MKSPGNIAVIGGGSWATALAKLLLNNCASITWLMHRADRIEDFLILGHNPGYLTDVLFDLRRITFTTDINRAAEEADTLLLALPSAYFKEQIAPLEVDISGKTIVSAIKGIVPDDNLTVSDYMEQHYGVAPERNLVVSGPCHAEEVALGRRSYLTVGGSDRELAEGFAWAISGPALTTIISDDVAGIEYVAVLKNVYAICAGIIHGLGLGDNFQAMLVSNAIREIDHFVSVVAPAKRNICDSVYLGDLLVTSYSRFSRNHNFGTMLGRGYSVNAAKMEMVQTAEGYYAAKSIHEINSRYSVEMPILEGMYDILYHRARPSVAVKKMADTFK